MNGKTMKFFVSTIAILFGLLIAYFVLSKRATDGQVVVGGVRLSNNQHQLIERVMEREELAKSLESTLWKGEIQAQAHGAYFEQLWDGFNRAADRWDSVGRMNFQRLLLPQFGERKAIGERAFVEKARAVKATEIDSLAWPAFLEGFRFLGYELTSLEIRHTGFTEPSQGQAAQSTFFVMLQVQNRAKDWRGLFKGKVSVGWQMLNGAADSIVPNLIDARALEFVHRTGAPGFEGVMDELVRPFEKTFFVDPLIVRDVDHDGFLDVVLAANNRVWINKGEFVFESRELCQPSLGLIFTALFEDIDGDGLSEFLVVDKNGLSSYKRSDRSGYYEAAQRIWTCPVGIKYGQVLSSGDIDQDGDMDLWLGQYKLPYSGGQMPTPYFDARDGYPSYLLINEGALKFREASFERGIGHNGARRVYSGSFLDIDSDGDLDLIEVSDFAGVVGYVNDGKGVFAEPPDRPFEEWQAFGMGHGFADFNRDGKLDFYMIGMNSPTAARLLDLGVKHPEFPLYGEHMASMTYGNRFYLGDGQGQFSMADFAAQVAETGWSWGSAIFDFENDGDLDVYIANGHESDASVRDFEPQFWMHDIYMADSEENEEMALYFNFVSTQLRGGGMSYGGYEHNRFLLRDEATGYIEIGSLHGVGFQEDSRNVLAADMNNDGQMDLVMTTFEGWPETKQTLKVLANRYSNQNRWIGIRFNEPVSTHKLVGSEVVFKYAGLERTTALTNGDGFRSQRPFDSHIGLGDFNGDHVSVALRQVGGKEFPLGDFEVNRWHRLNLPQDDR